MSGPGLAAAVVMHRETDSQEDVRQRAPSRAHSKNKLERIATGMRLVRTAVGTAVGTAVEGLVRPPDGASGRPFLQESPEQLKQNATQRIQRFLRQRVFLLNRKQLIERIQLEHQMGKALLYGPHVLQAGASSYLHLMRASDVVTWWSSWGSCCSSSGSRICSTHRLRLSCGLDMRRRSGASFQTFRVARVSTCISKNHNPRLCVVPRLKGLADILLPSQLGEYLNSVSGARYPFRLSCFLACCANEVDAKTSA